MLDKGEWVFKRKGSTKWTYAWAPDPTKAQKREQRLLPDSVRTERDAKRYVDEHRDALRARTKGGTRKKPTIADIAPRWKELRLADERLAESTVKDSLSHIKRHIVPKLGDVIADNEHLTTAILRGFVRELRRTRAAYTVRNIMATLRQFLDDANSEGWVKLDPNPAAAKAVEQEMPVQQPRAVRQQKMRVADLAVAQRLVVGEVVDDARVGLRRFRRGKARLAHLEMPGLRLTLCCKPMREKGKWGEPVLEMQLCRDCAAPSIPVERRVRYIVAFTSGVRDGELAGAIWSDVDLDGPVPTMLIQAALQLKRKRGSGRGKTKTEYSKRTIPLHPAALAALRWWHDVGWEEYCGQVPTPEAPIFVSAAGKPWRPRSADFFRRDLAVIGASYTVDTHPLDFHATRRSFASWLNAAGVPQEVRQHLLGHAPREVGARHYTEQDLPLLAQHIEKIDLRWRNP